MGNQGSLHGKDRIGAVLYSELRRKYDFDGTAVDDPSFRLLVSHWRSAATLPRQSQTNDLQLPDSVPGKPTVFQSHGFDSGHCGGDSPLTDRASSANAAALSQGSALEVHWDNCVKVGDPLVAVAACSHEATGKFKPACYCVEKPEHSGSQADSCGTCMTPISATLSSGYGKDDATSLKYSECWSGASDDEDDGEEEAVNLADPFDGDCAPAQIKLPSSPRDYHPLVDLLPRKARLHVPESVSEDRFSLLQSELDAVYAEARDIELCISRLSRNHPTTVTEVGRLKRALSSVETVSDHSISPETSRAAAVLRRRCTVVSPSKGENTRVSAPDAFVAWSDDSCQLALESSRFGNEESHQNSAESSSYACSLKEDGHSEWSHDVYLDEACPIMKYASQEHGDSTSDCHQEILKGYQNITEDFGCGYLYAVRADYYSAFRSCLAGALLRGLPVLDHLQSLEQSIKSLRECFDSHACLCNWGCAKDAKLPKRDIISLLERNLQVLYDQCYQAGVCPAAVREHVVRYLMNDSARDQASMEAVKALVMLRACQLHRAVASASGDAAAPDYARRLFACDTSRDPGTFFTNHLNGVGLLHSLEPEHMPLLADTLGMRLQVFRPVLFGQPDFVLNMSSATAPLQLSQDTVVRLIAEDDLHYGVAMP